MSDNLAISKQATDISAMHQQFQELLNLEPAQEPEARRKQLEQMEQLALGYFRSAAHFTEIGWNVIYIIVESGLWRDKLDEQGNPFTDYVSYVQSLYELAGKLISERSIHYNLTAFRVLGEIGVDAATRSRVLTNTPHIARKLLNKVVDVRTGDLRPLETDVRQQIMDVVGIQQEEQIDDREIVSEFFQMLPEIEHGEASSLVSRIIREWKRAMNWMRGDNILIIRFYQMGKKNKPAELHFKLIGGSATEKVGSSIRVVHPEAKKWLEGKRL